MQLYAVSLTFENSKQRFAGDDKSIYRVEVMAEDQDSAIDSAFIALCTALKIESYSMHFVKETACDVKCEALGLSVPVSVASLEKMMGNI